MTAGQTKTAIKNKLASLLPALLTAAGLDNFDDYLDEQPDETEKTQIGIYIADETDTTETHTLQIIIQAQLYKKGDWKQAYHDVLMPAIRQHITAALVEYVTRENIIADLWPVDKNSSSFGFYIIDFSEPLDDEDY